MSHSAHVAITRVVTRVVTRSAHAWPVHGISQRYLARGRVSEERALKSA